MRRPVLAATLATAVSTSPALAQKEALGMFYEIQMAPALCHWTDMPSSAKLDAQITAMEQGLAMTDAERAEFKASAETDLKADPSNCDKDGILRAMYVDAVK